MNSRFSEKVAAFLRGVTLRAAAGVRIFVHGAKKFFTAEITKMWVYTGVYLCYYDDA